MLAAPHSLETPYPAAAPPGRRAGRLLLAWNCSRRCPTYIMIRRSTTVRTQERRGRNMLPADPPVFTAWPEVPNFYFARREFIVPVLHKSKSPYASPPTAAHEVRGTRFHAGDSMPCHDTEAYVASGLLSTDRRRTGAVDSNVIRLRAKHEMLSRLSAAVCSAIKPLVSTVRLYASSISKRGYSAAGSLQFSECICTTA